MIIRLVVTSLLLFTGTVYADDVRVMTSGAFTAALQDLARGRRLEVEETLGYAVQQGMALGLPLPTMETCYRLIAGINWSLQGGGM